MYKALSWRPNSRPLPPTSHKHLYLLSNYRTHGVQWPVVNLKPSKWRPKGRSKCLKHSHFPFSSKLLFPTDLQMPGQSSKPMSNFLPQAPAKKNLPLRYFLERNFTHNCSTLTLQPMFAICAKFMYCILLIPKLPTHLVLHMSSQTLRYNSSTKYLSFKKNDAFLFSFFGRQVCY